MSFRLLATALVSLGFCLGACWADDVPPTRRTAPSRTEFVQVAYPVADLVVPVDYRGEGKQLPTLEAKLIELIRSTVDPKSWKADGGAALQYYPLGMSLVVWQSRERQAEVADLLAALRRLGDVEVSVSTHVVRVSEAAGERFVREAKFQEVKSEGADRRTPTAFLDAAQVRRWLESFQADAATNVLMAPKMTMANGQQAKLRCGDVNMVITDYEVKQADGQIVVAPKQERIEKGLRLELLPVVSADRRSIRLTADVKLTSVDDTVPVVPVTIKVSRGGEEEQEYTGTVAKPRVAELAARSITTVPDGGTVVFSLGRQLVETRSETSVPVLSQIPYLNRLVTNVGYGRETQHVFVFLTPRVIVNEEQPAPPARR